MEEDVPSRQARQHAYQSRSISIHFTCRTGSIALLTNRSHINIPLRKQPNITPHPRLGHLLPQIPPKPTVRRRVQRLFLVRAVHEGVFARFEGAGTEVAEGGKEEGDLAAAGDLGKDPFSWIRKIGWGFRLTRPFKAPFTAAPSDTSPAGFSAYILGIRSNNPSICALHHTTNISFST